MIRPEIGAQIPPLYCPPRHFLKPNRRRRRGPASSAENAVNMGLRKRDEPRNGARREPAEAEECAKVVHPDKGNTPTLTAQAGRSYFVFHAPGNNLPMPRYVQQPALKAAIKAYQARTGKKQNEVAEELGTTLGTLRQWLNNKERRPELESLQKISALTKVSVMEFIDDPGADYAGQDLSNESEETRFLAKAVIKGAKSKDLTDEQKIFILQDLKTAIERAMLAPARTPGQGREDHPGREPNIQPHPALGLPRRSPRPKR